MTREHTMETVREMIQEFEQAAWTIARVELDEESWTTLRARVVGLIERGDRALALVGCTGGKTWTAIRWDGADSPVVLARAFGVVHRRLDAALEGPMPAADGRGFAA